MKIWIAFIVVLAAGVLLMVPRMAEKPREWQSELIAAVRKSDVAAVKELIKKPVDIYALDVTGESALTLAEKSGNSELYAALAPRRNHDIDLRRAQDAVDAGRSLGLQPAAEAGSGIGRKIVAVRQDGTAGTAYLKQQRYTELREEIKALPDGARKNELFYTLASYQSIEGFYHEAAQTAQLMPDAEQRAQFLIGMGSNAIKDKDEARKQLLSAAVAIAVVEPQANRDALYSQLAFAQKSRQLIDDARQTCNLIVTPEHKTTPTCRF